MKRVLFLVAVAISANLCGMKRKSSELITIEGRLWDEDCIWADVRFAKENRIALLMKFFEDTDMIADMIDMKNDTGNTLLHAAVKAGMNKTLRKKADGIIKTLLKHNIALNNLNDFGSSPLNFAYRWLSCEEEIMPGFLVFQKDPIIKLLEDRGAQTAEEIKQRISRKNG